MTNPTPVSDGLEWLVDPAFEQLVKLQAASSAWRAGIDSVEDDVVNRIMDWLDEHRDTARASESLRPASQQRGPSDALASVDRLVQLASEIALQRGTAARLQKGDIEGTYKQHFCGFWPFCTAPNSIRIA